MDLRKLLKLFDIISGVVLKGGLEPPRAKAHCPLKTACLPVPPLQQTQLNMQLRFR